MNRKAALEHFVENYVDKESNEKLQNLKLYYENNKNTLIEGFVESFRKVCLKIIDMQDKGEKEKIGYITYSMLRTNIIDGKFAYLIEGFDKLWFFDRAECREEYDASWAFVFLKEFEEELIIKSKPYINKITKPDIERFKLKETVFYNNWVVELAKDAMFEAAKLTEFKEILKEDVLEIRVGEYKGHSEIVYIEETKA